MYHPTTRLLTILELLQTHPHLGGDELARRLEVEPRTIRRYIQMLQDMGMPIEGARGPGGGYRLRAGFKLPPLLFTEEEATAVVLGLLGTHWLEIDLASVAIEGALAKVYRVLPLKGRERLQAIESHMILSPHQQDARPDASLLVKLSEAVQECKRVAIEYSDHHNEYSQRQIEPYSVVGWRGHWYVVGFCCLRQGYRLFRLDRVRNVEFLSETFVQADDFDCKEFIVKRLATIPARWQIEVEFQAELHTVKQKIPPRYGRVTQTPAGVLFQSHHACLDEMARYLMGLNLPFVIHQPPELRESLVNLAQNMLKIASTGVQVAPLNQGNSTQ